MKLDKFIKRPVLSTVISILIVILGLLGLLTLPIEQYPNIAPPTVRVSTTYQGANAQTVLNSVIAPLEEQINGVENMDYMTSTATNTGSASISVYFKQGVDPDMAAVNVQNRVAKAQGFLPAEVTQVGVIAEKRQTSMLMGFALYSDDDRYDQKFLENYANINIVPEVKRVPGVGEAMVMGTDYSMRIWLKPDVMAEYKLMPSDVSAALAEQNIEAAPGQFGEQGNQSFQYVMRYKGRLQTEEEFENIVIRATENGEVLRLKDIANIELGRLTYGFSNEVNGHPGVTVMVFQTAGSNATSIIQNIEKYLKEIEPTLPPGMKTEVIMSANDFLFASIHEVVKTLLEAFLLVVIVVYVFLQDFRSTLIPLIAIPVALIGTFSLNLLTLCAMVLAIAIVVDDAIVVVEGVHAKLDQGCQSARKASIDAMSELGGAIVSITLVMMAVFIPVSFMTGTSGTFYRQFGLTFQCDDYQKDHQQRDRITIGALGQLRGAGIEKEEADDHRQAVQQQRPAQALLRPLHHVLILAVPAAEGGSGFAVLVQSKTQQHGGTGSHSPGGCGAQQVGKRRAESSMVLPEIPGHTGQTTQHTADKACHH